MGLVMPTIVLCQCEPSVAIYAHHWTLVMHTLLYAGPSFLIVTTGPVETSNMCPSDLSIYLTDPTNWVVSADI